MPPLKLQRYRIAGVVRIMREEGTDPRLLKHYETELCTLGLDIHIWLASACVERRVNEEV